MAETADSYEYEDGSGGVIEIRDGKKVTTSHYTPRNGYARTNRPKAEPVRMSEVGKQWETKDEA